jgi:exodeoxyribonuclease VII large subunit
MNQKKLESISVSESIGDKIKLKVADSKNEIKNIVKDVNLLIDKKFENCKRRLELTISLLSKLNPLELLKNGYTVLQFNNKRISSVEDCVVGEDITIYFADGIAQAQIKEIAKSEVKHEI